MSAVESSALDLVLLQGSERPNSVVSYSKICFYILHSSYIAQTQAKMQWKSHVFYLSTANSICIFVLY